MNYRYIATHNTLVDAKDRWKQQTLRFPELDHSKPIQNLETLASEAPSGEAILAATLEIAEMLLKKNVSYGNSALEPLRLFSSSSTEEQIYVRLDDKLSRLMNNQSFPGDNDIDDLIGYLILLKVARRNATQKD